MSKCGQDIEISIQVLDENTKRYAETFKCSNEILITISIANFVNATMLYVDLFIPQVFVLGFLNYFISGFTKDKDVFYSREFKEIRNKSTGA